MGCPPAQHQHNSKLLSGPGAAAQYGGAGSPMGLGVGIIRGGAGWERWATGPTCVHRGWLALVATLVGATRCTVGSVMTITPCPVLTSTSLPHHPAVPPPPVPMATHGRVQAAATSSSTHHTHLKPVHVLQFRFKLCRDGLSSSGVQLLAWRPALGWDNLDNAKLASLVLDTAIVFVACVLVFV